MSDPLATYLHDHMAGANFGMEVLEFLRDHHQNQPLAGSASALLAEVISDRNVLQDLIDKVGKESPVLKEAAAWIGEKVSELKLRQGALGTFEALETLGLGIRGKLAMWRALAEIADADGRLNDLDYAQLSARAEQQHARVEALRLEAARAALIPAK